MLYKYIYCLGIAYIFSTLTEFKTLTQVMQGSRDDSDDDLAAPSGGTPALSSAPPGTSTYNQGPNAPSSDSVTPCSVPTAAAPEVHIPRHKVCTTDPVCYLAV